MDLKNPKKKSKDEDSAKLLSIQKQALSLKNDFTYFAVGLQKKIAELSDSLFKEIKKNHFENTGSLLSELSQQVGIVNKIFSNSKTSFVGSIFKSAKNMSYHLEHIERQIEAISSGLYNSRLSLMKDNAFLEAVMKKSLEYSEDLEIYVQVAEEILKDWRTGSVSKTNPPSEADIASLEKKGNDLRTTLILTQQTFLQMKLIQEQNRILIDKLQVSILNTIPLWKNQVVIAVSLGNKKEKFPSTNPGTQTEVALQMGKDLESRIGETLRIQSQSQDQRKEWEPFKDDKKRKK